MLTHIQQLEAIPAKNVRIEGGFWAQRQQSNRDRTIPAIYHQLYLTGRLDAWRLNWQPDQPPPQIFFEADTSKWLEAVGHILATHPDSALEQQADDLIDRIENAQQPDGYLNIYFTTVEPHNRWRNLRDGHELFNAGHLIESAVAYYEGTGKRKFLDVVCRYADHIDAQFGQGERKRRGYCGHPVIEMALVKLYRATGEQRYLKLARYFIEERGQQPYYFDLEAAERGDDPTSHTRSYDFFQAHLPIRQQITATGHAVRACYLYSGLADIVAETGDETLLQASRLFWDDLTQHQMYVTGGVGPNHTDESLTFAYDLPNETAYAETCASVALVFWAHRMFHIDSDSRYIDVMERALYNGVLSSVSFDGCHFFYSNPLASYPNINPAEHWSGVLMDRFYRRSEWFKYACCPPNVARLVASIGSYFYSVSADAIYVHLYNENTVQFEIADQSLQIKQRTNYPWDGDIHFTIQTERPVQFDLALRIPGWCREFYVMVNGLPIEVVDRVRGYIRVSQLWVNGDEVTLSLAMPVERIAPHPHIRQDVGCVALQRGPVVYCMEEADNGSELASVVLPRHSRLTARMDTDLFNGISVISGEAMRIKPVSWPGGLYQPQSLVPYSNPRFTFRAIPYCFWANRDPGEMRVWIREM